MEPLFLVFKTIIRSAAVVRGKAQFNCKRLHAFNTGIYMWHPAKCPREGM